MSLLCDKQEDFVRSVYMQLQQAPAIIPYNRYQIDDIRTLCSQECIPSLRSVLSVDSTFNMSSLSVTAMVFRNKKVVRKVSQEPSIFVGPLMLHGDGKFVTYHHFFSSVNATLNGTTVDSKEIVCKGMVTGLDEEQALVNAAKTAFPNLKQLYCMIHCTDNARHYMANAGVSVQIRENVLARLFACNGVAEAGDEVTMDNRISDVMQYLRQSNVNESTTTYIQERILPKVIANNWLKWKEVWLGQHQWTNNNSESTNHLLKIKVSDVTNLYISNCTDNWTIVQMWMVA